MPKPEVSQDKSLLPPHYRQVDSLLNYDALRNELRDTRYNAHKARTLTFGQKAKETPPPFLSVQSFETAVLDLKTGHVYTDDYSKKHESLAKREGFELKEPPFDPSSQGLWISADCIILKGAPEIKILSLLSDDLLRDEIEQTLFYEPHLIKFLQGNNYAVLDCFDFWVVDYNSETRSFLRIPSPLTDPRRINF